MIGGKNLRWQKVREIECLDLNKTPVGRCGKNIGQLPRGRYGLASAVIKDKLHVCGGKSDVTCDTYSFLSRSWTREVSLDRPRFLPVSVMLSPDLWWIAGGQDSRADPFDTSEDSELTKHPLDDLSETLASFTKVAILSSKIFPFCL